MSEVKASDLLSVKQFAREYPNLGTEASMRWQIFCAAQNGLADAGAIVRRGKRVFVVVPRYIAHIVGESDAA